jgi:hypothetical protein
MKHGSRFKQGMRWGASALGLLFVVTSCSDLPMAPSRNTSGTPSSGATTSPTEPPAPVEPVAVMIASIAITPSSVEISAPHYTEEGEMPDQNSPNSDGSDLEHESAGFPTSALLSVTFRTEAGEIAPPQDLLWSTSNSQLLSVDETGWVQAIDPEVSGSATVTARLRSNPQVSASTTVVVRNDGLLAIELK